VTDVSDVAVPDRAVQPAPADPTQRGGFAERVGTPKAEVIKRALEPPFIADVKVDTGWTLSISFTNTEHTLPRVEICECAPFRTARNQWKFPKSGGAISAEAKLQGNRHYAEFDVLLLYLHAGKPYNYIITVDNDNPDAGWPEQSIGRFNMASTGNPGFRCDSLQPQLIRGVDGSTADCSPYFCRGAKCETTCNSVSDCVAPTLCDTNGQCVYVNR
jgi:hypothetical protein